MFQPTLPTQPTTRELTDAFYGYRHQLRIPDGEWYDMKNLTGDHFPLMASRGKRGTVLTCTNEPLGVGDKEALVHIDGGTLYVNGAATGLTTLSTPTVTRSATEPATPAVGQYWYNTDTGITKKCTSTTGPTWAETEFPQKQLVSMGAYVCVFPDKKYVNTMRPSSDYGSMEETFTAASGLNITYTLSNSEGEAVSGATISSSAPATPSNGDYWVDTSGDRSVLRRWNQGTSEWVEIPTCYVTIGASGSNLGKNFSQYDGVELSGCAGGSSVRAQAEIEALNGSHVIYARTDDSITIVGILSEAVTQTTTSEATVTVARKVPDMDYVCEAGNRLWGCYYGLNADNEVVNELYCSALGDFKNWRRYMGISTDSWAASCGSDGQWTGAVNFFGSPTFFKEDHIHVVSISSSGAHQVTDYVATGVQKGSWRSLAVAGDTLFYKSRTGVMAYQGGIPVSVSDALGEAKYVEAAAGAYGQRYYLSMRGADGWKLFCLDTASGRWYLEDDTHAVGFTAHESDVYALCADKKLLALRGSQGTPEGDVEWSATSGVLYYERPDRKYVTHYQLRLRLAEGAWAKLEIQYNSSGIWEDQGTIRQTGLDGAVVPVRPRRCDHCAIRLSGCGEVRLFSIARILENGSDWR